MRPGDRRGAGGKSSVILDLIEHYWDQIEGDFATELHGLDARDWIRGRRPWDQFLNYCTTVARTPGTQLNAAQLNDDRYLAEFKKLLDEAPAVSRPPIEGHTRLIQAIYMLANEVRAQTRQLAKVDLRPILGPEMPADRLRDQKKRHGLARIASLLKGE